MVKVAQKISPSYLQLEEKPLKKTQKRNIAGFSYFRAKGHFLPIALLKTLYNYTIAKMLKNEQYVAISLKNKQPAHIQQVMQDIQTASVHPPNEYSYSDKKHKKAIFICGRAGSGKTALINTLLKKDIDDKKDFSKDVDPQTNEDKKKLYELPAFKQKSQESQYVDWPNKVHNAGLIVFCYSTAPGSKYHENDEDLYAIIRHLPVNSQTGRPDFSKFKIFFTFDNMCRDHCASMGKDAYEKQQKIFREKIKTEIQNEFQYEIPDDVFTTQLS